MNVSESEIVALCERFRARARTFMRKVGNYTDSRDIARLTAMASTLEWIAKELCFVARVNSAHCRPRDLEQIAQEREAADLRLARDQKEPQP